MAMYITINVSTKYLGEGMSEVTSGDLKAGDIVLVGGSGGMNLNFGMPGGAGMRMGF